MSNQIQHDTIVFVDTVYSLIQILTQLYLLIHMHTSYIYDHPTDI